MAGGRKTITILIGVVCLVYIAVRLWRVSDSCLWFDEIFSVHAAEHSWGSLFWFVAQDLIHPPLFYALLKLWIMVGGDSLLWIRLFPVVFSSLALLPLLHLCRELKLKRSSTALALGLLAVNGSLIKYSQEVRMYAPLFCFSLFSIWLFSRFYFRGKNIWLLTLTNVILVYTHYFGWFVVLAEVVSILALQRVKIRHVLIMFAIVFAAFVPWLVAILRAASGGADVAQNIGWMTRPGIRAIFEFVFDAVEPFYFQQSSSDPTSLLFITIPLLIVIGVAKIAFLRKWKQLPEKDSFYLLSIVVAVPLILSFIISWIGPVSIWGSRHLLIVYAPLAMLAAMFVTGVDIKALRITLIVLIASIVVAAFVLRVRTSQPAYIWCAWENLAKESVLQPHLSGEARTVYVFEDLVAYHFWFAIRDLPNYRIKVVKGIEGLREDTAYFLPRGFSEVERAELDDISGDRIWIAFREPTRPEKETIAFLDDVGFGTPVTDLIRQGYEIEDVRKFVAGPETGFLIRMAKTGASR